MTDYSKLSDREIDSLVLNVVYGVHAHDKDIQGCWSRGGFKYTNNWSDAGPIIVENGISLSPYFNGEWLSAKFSESRGEPGKIIYYHQDKNPLRAAMIVFLQMQENKQ